MAFTVSSYQHPRITQHDATIIVLEDGAGSRAEVWPGLGFSCFRWQALYEETPLELLFHAPETFFNGEKPTRSGIPVLFPFPNRIRDGRFSWEGRAYQLPLNDPDQRNTIHGFVNSRPWRVIDQGASEGSAWVTGLFRGSVDAPECSSLWPTDYQIQLTCRLGIGSLQLEAEISNPDQAPLPFGLGYHPYFRMPFTDVARQDDCLIEVPAASYWRLQSSLPTGEHVPVDARLDLRQPRSFADLQVDDILTDLPEVPPTPEGLLPRATIQGAPGATLQMLCSPSFRDLVIFTPAHRKAFSVEPYTCVTDAINLQQKGIDAGWQVLPPGEVWRGMVQLRLITV